MGTKTQIFLCGMQVPLLVYFFITGQNNHPNMFSTKLKVYDNPVLTKSITVSNSHACLLLSHVDDSCSISNVFINISDICDGDT